MNIQIFGHVNVDKNTSEQSSYVAAGSPAMFINKVYRQLSDCNVSIIASYGADYKQYLQDVNIYPANPNCNKTLIYENVSKMGGRTQKAYHREEAQPVPLAKTLKNTIKEADIIFFAPLLPNFPEKYFSQVASYTNKNAYKVLPP